MIEYKCYVYEDESNAGGHSTVNVRLLSVAFKTFSLKEEYHVQEMDLFVFYCVGAGFGG